MLRGSPRITPPMRAIRDDLLQAGGIPGEFRAPDGFQRRRHRQHPVADGHADGLFPQIKPDQRPHRHQCGGKIGDVFKDHRDQLRLTCAVADQFDRFGISVENLQRFGVDRDGAFVFAQDPQRRNQARPVKGWPAFARQAGRTSR